MTTKQKLVTFPAPVGGWNARDPLADMEIADAISLENIIPVGEGVELRNGYTLHCNTASGAAIERMFEYLSATGTRKLIAASSAKLYDATSSTPTDITNGRTITINTWQGVQYMTKLYLFNGTDAPIETQGTGASTLATAWTNDPSVPALTKANLINPSVYKQRLYVVEKGTASYWYSKPALYDLGLYWEDVSSFLTRGGSLIYAGSWTKGTADTSEDVFVVVSNQGEILVYTGLDPQAGDWTLSAHYYVGRPLGYRSAVNVGSDLLLIAEDGIFPLSSLIQQLGATVYSSLSDKIRNAWQANTRSYGANVGWHAINYPQKNLLIVNVPIVANSQAQQFVLNTKLGAWCKFTGMNACSWVMYNGLPYFGDSAGKIYKADYGQTDNEAAIVGNLQTAYSTFKSQQNKAWKLAQPLLVADNGLSYAIDVAVDYAPKVVQATVETPPAVGATWDVATWDVDEWAGGDIVLNDWQALADYGRAGSIIMQGSYKNVSWRLSAINAIYTEGGIR